MYKYKQSKKIFIGNIIVASILPIVSFIIPYLVTNKLELSLGISLCNLINDIYIIINLAKEFNSSIFINKEELVITSRGKRYRINNKEIMSITYQGIAKSIIWDNLILECGMVGKIYVNSYYNNYVELWKQIIEYAQEDNPRVNIDPKAVNRVKISYG